MAIGRKFMSNTFNTGNTFNTSKEVFAKRREGKIDEAYQIACQLVDNPSADDWDFKAYAWCLIDLIKREITLNNQTNLNKYKHQLERVNISIDDEVLLAQKQKAIQLCNPNRPISSSDVFAKRKEGNIDETYQMAMKLMNIPDKNEWDVKAIAYCIIDMIKRDNELNNSQNLIYYRNQLQSLNVSEDDEVLKKSYSYALRLCNPNNPFIKQAKEHGKQRNFVESINIYNNLIYNGDTSETVCNSLAWDMYKHSKELLENNTTNFSLIKRYLHKFLQLGIVTPTQHNFNEDKPEIYTLMLRIAHKLTPDNINMASFVRMWNLDNLTVSDFRENRYEGQIYPSLAEKVIQSACKDAIKRHAVDEVSYLLPYLEKCIKINQDNIWLVYYKTKSLVALQRNDEATNYAITVIKNKSKDFWAWELLGDILSYSNNELAFSAYCKAVLCSDDINFTSKVRVKLANHFICEGKYNFAKTEIEKIVSFKEQNEHRIPEEIQSIISQDWYPKTNISDENQKFYKESIQPIENYLYKDISWVNAIIGNTYKIEDKKARRKIYIDDNGILTEISLPEKVVQNIGTLEEKMGIRVKGEFDEKKRFTLFLMEKRELKSETDIFKPVIGVVDHVNKDKKLLHFLVDKKIDGIIRFSELKDDFSEYEAIKVVIVKYFHKNGVAYKAINARKTSSDIPESLIKNFQDVVNVNNGMGFTEDDIFVAPPIISKNNIEDGDVIGGKAILNYNKKRSEWGWRVIEVH